MGRETGRYRARSIAPGVWVVDEEWLCGIFRKRTKWECVSEFTTCGGRPVSFHTEGQAVSYAQSCMKRAAERAAFVSRVVEVEPVQAEML